MEVRHMPMMDKRIVRELNYIMDGYIGPEPFDVFEWGSGGSTIWFARKNIGKVISAEHNLTWFKRVASEAKGLGLENCSVHYHPPIPKKGCRDSFGHMYSMPNMSFRDYIKCLPSLKIKFDLILIDGRARVKCFKEAIKHVKKRGIIILHDSERECYRECEHIAVDSGFFAWQINERRSSMICEENE